MQKLTGQKLAGAVVAALLLTPSLAAAETYASNDSGFSADFLADPDISAPRPSTKDADGNVESNTVSYSAGQPGDYYSAVTVDTFLAPTPLDVAGSLAAERDAFASSFGSVTSSRTDTFQGEPAVFFTFASDDGTQAGRGMVVILDQPTPRIYLVTMVHKDSTPRETVDALNSFVDSFKLL
jgi:hypothetical protein